MREVGYDTYNTHTHTHTHTHTQRETCEEISLTVILRTSQEQRRVLGAGVERERGEVDFQTEREAPHQTYCTSAVVDTAQVNSDRGQLALVLQCEVSDY